MPLEQQPLKEVKDGTGAADARCHTRCHTHYYRNGCATRSKMFPGTQKLNFDKDKTNSHYAGMIRIRNQTLAQESSK